MNKSGDFRIGPGLEEPEQVVDKEGRTWKRVKSNEFSVGLNYVNDEGNTLPLDQIEIPR